MFTLEENPCTGQAKDRCVGEHNLPDCEVTKEIGLCDREIEETLPLVQEMIKEDGSPRNAEREK